MAVNTFRYASIVCLTFILTAVTSATRAEIHGIAFHPDAPIDINVEGKSMFDTWGKPAFPKDIGMDSSRKYYFINPTLWSNRKVYWQDEEVAQFFALFPEQETIEEGDRLIIRIKTRTGASVEKAETVAKSNKTSFLVDIGELKPGTYSAQVNWTPGNTLKPRWIVTTEFEVADKRHEQIGMPSTGIPIQLQQQSLMSDGSWPIAVGVPLPRGLVRDVSKLVLHENGKPVAADIYPRSKWGPGEKASIKWIHLHFQGRYVSGLPAKYELRLAGQLQRSNLKVQQTDSSITVENGHVKFIVSRSAFNGIERAWYDPTGQGKYHSEPDINADENGGAYLVDEKGTRYTAAADKNVDVSIELDGVSQLTIVAKGWYVNPADPSDRLCKFVTRINSYADQPMLRVKQNTYITFDTWDRQLADLGFKLPITQGERYAFGLDEDKLVTGALKDQPTYLVQERHNAVRIVNADNAPEAEKSAGWFTMLQQNGKAVSIALRDVWQKYPKEAQFTRDGISIHFWPEHGRDVFSDDEQMAFANLYKFLCFHHGKLMNLKTPTNYVERFDTYAKDKKSNKEGSHKWWRESEHDATRDGRATGAIIANDFAIHFAQLRDAEAAKEKVGSFAQLLQLDPSALASPTWNAATGALGPMAAADREHYAEFEEALVEGWLGWGEGMVKRYNDYGMFNYADTHTVHLIDEQRPGLHRVWQGSHYHNMGTNWVLYFRTGDPRLLRWARKNVDHYLNIDMTNYVNEENPVPVRDHVLGGMQHMGWKTHWASSGEAWGQYKDVFGHFIDGDSLIWTWYLDANPRALENHRNWSTGIKSKLRRMYRGTAREVNNSFANMLTLYTETWDPELIPYIYSIADSLARTPLENQRPGPMWHPLWINRYHELTRDGEYDELVKHYAVYFKGGVESTWTGALAARAYDITGDKSFLEIHRMGINTWPRTFYRLPYDPYDWFGNGDGPLGGNYRYLTWGNYLKRLQDAGYTGPPDLLDVEELPYGNYPFASARFTHPGHPPSVVVYAVAPTSKPVTVKKSLSSLGGSLHAVHAWLHRPDGKVAWEVKRIGTEGDENQPQTTSGKAGLWRLEYHSHEARVPFPQTDLEHEAQYLRHSDLYRTNSVNAFVKPIDTSQPVKLTISSQSDRDPTHVRVFDNSGKLIIDRSLFAPRPDNGEATVTLNAREHPLPWRIDTIGMTGLKIESETDLLLSNKKSSLQVVEQNMKRFKAERR